MNERLYPTTLFCSDFSVGECCKNCHEKSWRITIYPHSCYSEGQPGPLPDCGLGVHGEVCCGRYEAVRALPRAFWLEVYGRKHGWSEAHIAELIAAPPEKYFKVSGEIGSYYFKLRNPSVGTAVVGRSRNPVSRAVRVSKCPACGQKWSGDVCENCGHGGGI